MSMRTLTITYQMHTATAASHKLVYETPKGQSVTFVTGMGLMFDAFEQHLENVAAGSDFDFVLSADEIGQRDETQVRTVPRSIFEVNGKFDDENIYPGAEVQMMDSEGNYFWVVVVAVDADSVTIDRNHPLAGKAIRFTGTVIENREATLQEIEATARILAGESSCGGCGGCGGCGDDTGNSCCGSQKGCGGCGK